MLEDGVKQCVERFTDHIQVTRKRNLRLITINSRTHKYTQTAENVWSVW